MSLQGKETKKLYKKAMQYLPYGVSSNFRYWGEEDNLVIAKGEGAYIWDADGNEYIDFCASWGPLILGHANGRVEDAIIAAGLDWEVEKRPVFVENPDVTGWVGAPSEYVEIEGQFAIVRTTDDKALGVVGSKYTPIQNSQAFKFLDELTGRGKELRYHTAGSLKGGTLVWLLAELQGFDFEVVPGDPVKPFLLWSNYHNGAGSVTVAKTNVHVVCANTHSQAINRDGRKGVKIRHSGDIMTKLDDAREVLSIVVRQTVEYTEQLRFLASRQISSDQWGQYLDHVLPLPPIDEETGERVSNPTRAQNNRDNVTDLFENGMGVGIPGVRGTRWAAFNAVTEFTTHHRTTRGAGSDLNKQSEKRLESTWFGSGQVLNQKAFDYLLAA